MRKYQCVICGKGYSTRKEAITCGNLPTQEPAFKIGDVVLGVVIEKAYHILHVSGRSGKARHIVAYRFETPLVVGDKVFHRISEPGLLSLISRIAKSWPERV